MEAVELMQIFNTLGVTAKTTTLLVLGIYGFWFLFKRVEEVMSITNQLGTEAASRKAMRDGQYDILTGQIAELKEDNKELKEDGKEAQKKLNKIAESLSRLEGSLGIKEKNNDQG